MSNSGFRSVLADIAFVVVGFSALLVMLRGCSVSAAEPPATAYRAEIPVEIRELFRNPDGSCVQCSNGMAGWQINVPQLTLLLWNSEYGPAVRGGSSPSRVENYCNQRGIKVYNVTGSGTWDFMRWAAKTGRFCAIGAGSRHFQFLYGWDPQTNRWYVCNNNSPQRIDEYSWTGFQKLHRSSGEWVVVPDYPPMPMAPRYVAWWAR
jgi:hypothetical protein